MTPNADTSVQQIQQDFQALIAYVTGPETRTATAYTVELTLFRRLLAVGAALLRVFFQTRAAARPAGPVHAPDGTALAYHDCRPTTYYSVFGKVRFARHFFTAVGQEGVCPLDAALSLPARSYSDLLQEWGTYGTTDASYHESGAALERILGLGVGSAARPRGLMPGGGAAAPPPPSRPCRRASRPARAWSPSSSSGSIAERRRLSPRPARLAVVLPW